MRLSAISSGVAQNVRTASAICTFSNDSATSSIRTVFFIGIGVQLPLGLIPDVWPAVLIWLAILIIGKALIVILLGMLFGEEAQVMRRAGMILGHGGEFGLMLVSVSLSSGLISDMVAGPILLAIGISMPIGSILVRRAARSGAGVD